MNIAAVIEQIPYARRMIPKPINFNVNYLRTAGPADCSATTEVVKLGRRIAHVRVVGWQEDAKRPFASGYGSFLV